LSTSESLRNGRGIWKVRAIPRWQDCSRAEPADLVVEKANRALVRRVQPRDHVERRALARAVRPDQAEDLVLLQPERDVRDRREAAEALRETADL
jgi:hypothetical protein